MANRQEQSRVLRSRLLDFYRKNPDSSKTEAAVKLGVTFPTISTYITKLKDEGELCLVDEDGMNAREAHYHVVKDKKLFAGISIGSSQVKVCLVNNGFEMISSGLFQKMVSYSMAFDENEKYHVLDENDSETYGRFFCYETPQENPVELRYLLNYILLSIIRLNELCDDVISGVGISITGRIKDKTVVDCPNLGYMTGVNMEDSFIASENLQYFQSRNIPVIYCNNTEAAAVAERWSLYFPYGIDESRHNELYKYRNIRNIVNLYFGAGIGMCFSADENISAHQDVGHLPVPYFRNVSDDFWKDCEENSLNNRMMIDVLDDKSLSEYRSETSGSIKSKLKNTEKAELLGRHLAYLIGLIELFEGDTDLIVIGGKLYQSEDELNLYIKKWRKNKEGIPAVFSALGPAASAIGAAITAAKQLELTDEAMKINEKSEENVEI